MSMHIDYEINKELGECYLFMGEYEKAQDYYQKAINSDGKHADPYLGIATIALQYGNFVEAQQAYEKALALEVSDKAYAGLALAEISLEQYNFAFEHLKAALEFNPLNMVAMNSIVQLAYQIQRSGEVLSLLEKSLAIKEDETIRFTLAGFLSNLDRVDEAKEQLKILLGQNPNNSGAQELYAHLVA